MRPISSPSSTCCDKCFPSSTSAHHTARLSLQLSDVYSPNAEALTNSPSCLTTITKQRAPDEIKTLLNVESEIEYSKNFKKKLKQSQKKVAKKVESLDGDTYEIASEATNADNDEDISSKLGVMTENEKKFMIKVEEKEELPEKKKIDNNNVDDEGDLADGNNNPSDIKYSTLPIVSKSKHKRSISIPQRITQDGTKISYICDLPKSIKKGCI